MSNLLRKGFAAFILFAAMSLYVSANGVFFKGESVNVIESYILANFVNTGKTNAKIGIPDAETMIIADATTSRVGFFGDSANKRFLILLKDSLGATKIYTTPEDSLVGRRLIKVVEKDDELKKILSYFKIKKEQDASVAIRIAKIDIDLHTELHLPQDKIILLRDAKLTSIIQKEMPLSSAMIVFIPSSGILGDVNIVSHFKMLILKPLHTNNAGVENNDSDTNKAFLGDNGTGANSSNDYGYTENANDDADTVATNENYDGKATGDNGTGVNSSGNDDDTGNANGDNGTATTSKTSDDTTILATNENYDGKATGDNGTGVNSSGNDDDTGNANDDNGTATTSKTSDDTTILATNEDYDGNNGTVATNAAFDGDNKIPGKTGYTASTTPTNQKVADNKYDDTDGFAA